MLRNILSFVLFATIAHTQSDTVFEVASLKLAPEGDILSIKTDGGMARYSNLTLRQLIAIANRIDNSRVVGGPAWLDTQHYDVVAKLPPGATRDQIPPMLDHLIQERLKVVVHRETKDQKVLALVVAKGGPKLKESAAGEKFSLFGRAPVTGTAVFMYALVQVLSQQVGRVVVDKTGLTGNFEFELEYAPTSEQIPERLGGNDVSTLGANAGIDLHGPSLFTALREQLGLKLESQKGPVEMVIVDRAERLTEN